MVKNVRSYVICTVIVALSVGGILYANAPHFDGHQVQAVLCLCAIALLTQLLGYTMTRAVTGTISFVPFLACAALVPHWLTAVGILVVTTTIQCIRTLPILKKVFNVAQQFLSMSVAILVYLAIGGHPLSLEAPFPYVRLLALFVTLFAVNSLSVSGVIAVSERRRFSDVWTENNVNSSFTFDLLSCPVIFGLAWIYLKAGVGGAFGLAVPILGLRQLYKFNHQLEQANQELLELMVAAIEARDPYTSGHSRRVSHNAKLIAQILGLPKSTVRHVEVAALLHDVGKIHEIFAPILQKPGRLTDEEHAIMQTHPIKSEELVAKVSQLRDIVPAVRHHHENWDGTGYPDGIAGERIPLASRIIIFADTIDAMTSDRPYRKALDETTVRAELVKYRARQFDPQICDALLSSPRYAELFLHAPHSSLPHTQEVPKLRLAVQS